MTIAIIGCGYVADFYGKTLANYPQLKLAGAFDTDAARTESFCKIYGGRAYPAFEALLADDSVEMVLNLTNPRAHFETTSRCLKAGKHVYSEKPLAMNPADAATLVALAKEKNLRLAAAPCSVLSETAQTLWKALRDGMIGKVRLVYANFDDGMIAPQMSPWNWRNESGVAWPAKDEFEVGCTYEHAGYVLTWLGAFFGPARRVTSFASTQIPDKGITVEKMAPDFTVGCIEYDDNVVARVTCGLVAPKDKSLTIVGDEGVLHVTDVRNDAGAVYLRLPQAPCVWERAIKRIKRALPIPFSGEEWLFQTRLPLIRAPRGRFVSKSKPVDFCRGPAEMVAAIREQRPSRLSAEFAWHITELVEALQYPNNGGTRHIESNFPPIAPLI